MVGTGVVSESMRSAVVAALPKLRRFCHAMAGTAADGDDLMQATVERALMRAELFEPGTRIDSWLYRIAQNIHIDQIRAVRRRGIPVPVEDAHDLVGDDGVSQLEGRSDLARAMQTLQSVPEDLRAAFVLVVIEGQSYRDAAETLQIPVGTVMSRISRARRRIAEALSGNDGADS